MIMICLMSSREIPKSMSRKLFSQHCRPHTVITVPYRVSHFHKSHSFFDNFAKRGESIRELMSRRIETVIKFYLENIAQVKLEDFKIKKTYICMHIYCIYF